jgi:DNA-directed RNA polymerase
LALDLVLPNKSDYVVSKYPDSVGTRWDLDLKDETLDISEQELNEIVECRREFTDKAELYNAEVKDYESELGKYRAIKLAIGIAESYMDEEELYFPHSYDFRGRVYPIAVGLSPQGSDGVKAILEYKNGEVLTEEGEAWAWAYLASLYGEDKLDFKDRIDLGMSLIDEDYKNADEPYQFLAHQLELKKFLKDKNYLFKGRVHLDACNSGSQFTSTMTGDVEGCKATNVIPTYRDGKQVRQDAYLLVANRALELTNSTIDNSLNMSQTISARPPAVPP